MKPYQIIDALNSKNVNIEELKKVKSSLVNIYILDNYKLSNLELIDLIKPINKELKEHYTKNIEFNDEEIDYMLENSVLLSNVKISIDLQDKYHSKIKSISFDDTKVKLENNITVGEFKKLTNKDDVLINNLDLLKNHEICELVLNEILDKKIDAGKYIGIILKNIDFNKINIDKINQLKGIVAVDYKSLEENDTFKNKISKIDFFKNFNNNLGIFNLEEITEYKEIITQDIINKKTDLNNVWFFYGTNDKEEIEEKLIDITFFEKLIEGNYFEDKTKIKISNFNLFIHAIKNLKKENDLKLLNIIFKTISIHEIESIKDHMSLLFKVGITNKNLSQYKGLFREWLPIIEKENKEHLLIELLEENKNIINTKNGKLILRSIYKRFRKIYDQYYINEVTESEDYDALNIKNMNFLYGKDLYTEINKNKNKDGFLKIALNNFRVFEYLSKDNEFLRKNADEILDKLESLPISMIESISKLDFEKFVKKKEKLIDKLKNVIDVIKSMSEEEYQLFEKKTEESFLLFFKVFELNKDEEELKKLKKTIVSLLKITKEYNDEIIIKLIEEKDFRTLSAINVNVLEKIEKNLTHINFKEIIKDKKAFNLIKNLNTIKLIVDNEDYDELMLMSKKEIEKLLPFIENKEIIRKIISDSPDIFVGEHAKNKTLLSFFGEKAINRELLDKEEALLLYQSLVNKNLKFCEKDLVSIIKNKEDEYVLSFFKEKSEEIYCLLILENKSESVSLLHEIYDDNRSYASIKDEDLMFDTVIFKNGLEKIIKYNNENKFTFPNNYINKICYFIDEDVLSIEDMEKLMDQQDLLRSEKYRKFFIKNITEEKLSDFLEARLALTTNEIDNGLIAKLISKRDYKLIDCLIKTIHYYKQEESIKTGRDSYTSTLLISLGMNEKIIDKILRNKKYKNLEETLELYRDTKKTEVGKKSIKI